MGSVVVACDGFGEDLKNHVAEHLRGRGLSVDDLGTDKYYAAAAGVAKRVQPPASGVTGMLFCGTGLGVGMIANKFSGVLAATCENETAARNARAVNNANVLALGGLITPPDEAVRIADAFLDQKFVTAPCGADGTAPAWWSEEVEEFLKASTAEIAEVEQKSRAA